MATPAKRRIIFNEIKHFGTQATVYEIPDLTVLQTDSYKRFLQEDVPPKKRADMGLESVLRESFPIENFDKNARLEYLYYELEKPRYTPDECRQLRMTYGKPFKVRLRLVRETGTYEEDVYLGDIPIMLGGGEFIINGAERVVVSQLHRSPGIDFVQELDGDRKVYNCRIIPERGSWLEINFTRKETLSIKIDQSSKLPIMMLLRAMSKDYSTNANLIKEFFHTERVDVLPKQASSKSEDKSSYLEGKISVSDIEYPKTHEKYGEIIVESCDAITKAKATELRAAGVKKIEIIKNLPKDKQLDRQKDKLFYYEEGKLLLNCFHEDKTKLHEEALAKIYMRLRPGNPPQLDKARELFNDKFFDVNRYRLGQVGRFRINRKLGLNIPEEVMTLRAEDIMEAVKYVNRLWIGDRTAEIDDIDHLGNRRLRTIDELASDELRKGFLKLRRTVQERLQARGNEADVTPRQVINQKSVSAAIEYFFSRGELSQVVDQTNPLSMLTHERRLSALGPGGLNRKRAGFDVRDVHSSHYGRICPIETPEGTNIGLISSLSIYAAVDKYGFLISPYRRVKNGKLVEGPEGIEWLKAYEEHESRVAPADTKIAKGKIIADEISGMVVVRCRGDYDPVEPSEIDYIDVSPSQMIGVSAGLIPFLEHDDANRALMGSNMQRQAVPLLESEPALVATGLERKAAFNSSLMHRAKRDGKVTYVDSQRIKITTKEGLEDEYVLRKFVGMNERTCQNQVAIVKPDDKVEVGDVIADGASMYKGELCLGRNVLAAFMTWDGFNFEDAIIISEDLVNKDTYTSIHIEEFDIEVRDTKLGREEFTNDIPNVGEKALRSLDESGIVCIGTYVRPGDILVGKVTPRAKAELTPEEKLLHAIFGRHGEDVKNESLEVPSGVEGIVIGTQKFSCRMSLSEEERKAFDGDVRRAEKEEDDKINELFNPMIAELEKATGVSIDKSTLEQPKLFRLEQLNLEDNAKAKKVYEKHWTAIEEATDAKDRRINTMKRGDELRRGVLQMVKVYIAAKRVISVGDKMAGRHGNKGVISKILPREDMPYLADGTPVEILLNPLGVPSRMNVGQILETHLGWAAARLGYQAVTPVFGGVEEAHINEELEKAGLPKHGKVQLRDGRTGELFDQETTVGYIYMLKLHHLVDDKVHARSTGPYSLITQQPLGGKARFGGQRFGEMEVWALEAYGAAYTLQELLTVKSDDVEGRTKIYESMVKGKNTLEAGTPASFDVLTNEIRGLGINMQLEKIGETGLDHVAKDL